MNYMKSYEISEKILDKIISVAYGKASIFNRIAVARMIKKDTHLKKVYEEYKNTANLVHSIQLEKYKKSTEVEKNKSNKRELNVIEEIYSIFIGRPLVYSAAVTVLFIAIIFSVFIKREISFDGYSIAEVEKAEKESKLALAIVADIFNDAGKKIKTDILYNEVSKPINEGINTVNKLFNKEKKK